MSMPIPERRDPSDPRVASILSQAASWYGHTINTTSGVTVNLVLTMPNDEPPTAGVPARLATSR